MRKVNIWTLYAMKIQWFEPHANKYMPLTYVAPGIETFPELKNFTWDEVANFAKIDRPMAAYTNKFGPGDWKTSQAKGFVLVTVDKYPYWADAIGNIPFAVDYYTDMMFEHSSLGVDNWIRATLAAERRFSTGKVVDVAAGLLNLGPTAASGEYDEFMTLRGAVWASNVYKLEPTRLGVRHPQHRIVEYPYPANALHHYIGLALKAKFL